MISRITGASSTHNELIYQGRKNITNRFSDLYTHLNQRKIELVISEMTEDVKWANGMDVDYVFVQSGAKEYWTRQFTLMNSKVTPLEIKQINRPLLNPEFPASRVD